MIFKGNSARHSIDGSTINIDLTKLDINSKITRPVYTQNNEKDYLNPSVSQVLNTITRQEPFQIDKYWINQDFKANYNKDLREWYFSNFTQEETINLRNNYYSFIEENEINFYFFDWLENHCKENNIIKSINPLTRNNKTWKTTNNEIIISEYPPMTTIKIKIDNEEVEASPYKTINESEKEVSKKDIKKNHNQINFSNSMLKTMSKQLTRIEDKDTPSSSIVNSIPKPLVKPIYQLNTHIDSLKLGNESDSKIEEIKELLSKLTLGKPSINTIDTDDFSINKIKTHYPKTTTYYPRSSPADVLYEERGEVVQNSYSGSDICEWNIDGMSEQNILDFICQMSMAASAYKRRGNSDKATAMTLVQGFTGQLKGWWDKFWTQADREAILNVVKHETREEDAVATLIYTIIQHFVGDPNTFKDRAASQLANLYCPTMSDYRWYKDVFMSKITLREDRFQGFWKERFLAGLPKLFSEKVKIRLESHFGKPIPFNTLTYGQIHSIIIDTGIQACNDLLEIEDFKLQNKLRKETGTNKREIGNFCEQYGVEPIRAPSAIKRKNQRKQVSFQKPYKKSYNNYKKSYKKCFKKNKDYFEKPKTFNKPKSTKKNITCWKCGKACHFANKCKTQQKINELEIDESLKKTLIAIMINSESEEDDSTSEEDNNTEIIYQLEEDSSSSQLSQEDDCCLGPDLCTCNDCKTINMLTVDQTHALIELISQLEHGPIRIELISKLEELLKKDEKEQEEIKEIDLKEIYSRFRQPSPITIKDLQDEIKILKTEITNLKQDNISIEYRLLELEGKEKIREQQNLNIDKPFSSTPPKEDIDYLNLITTHKWHCNIKLLVKNEEFNIIALIDSGAEINCIQEGIIPFKYYEKTTQKVLSANNSHMKINYKLSSAKICKNKICYETSFVLVKNMNISCILGTPFLSLLYPFKVTSKGLETQVLGNTLCFEFIHPPKTRELNLLKENATSIIESKRKHINFLSKEIQYKRIEEQLQSKNIQETIKTINDKIKREICELNPTAF
uniref:CCHC-type domain-containing protein n=1 Tax=Cajanus cajan TaxID=3821 RepID=A0A151TFW5_CAJCA|nr:hypothetical protein KK1_012162 [Cajanus cajan]